VGVTGTQPPGQARRQDFAAGEAKKPGGHLNKILDVCSNRGPNMKWVALILNGGAGHHCSPAGDGPAQGAVTDLA